MEPEVAVEAANYHIGPSKPVEQKSSTARSRHVAVLLIAVAILVVVCVSEVPQLTTRTTATDATTTTTTTPIKVTIPTFATNEHEQTWDFPPGYFSEDTDNTTVCWKDSYGRGVGTVPDQCPGEDKNGALCYPYCRSGYTGVGPVCWEDCPPGWIDEGALCRKKGSIETKAKKSYGRGAGTVMHCAESQEEQSGLCYNPCRGGYDGVGPVCWASCTGLDPVDGGAICCRNSSVCTSKIIALSTGVPLAVAKAILSGGDPQKVIAAVIAAIDSALGFVMPLCSQLPPQVQDEGDVAAQSLPSVHDEEEQAQIRKMLLSVVEV